MLLRLLISPTWKPTFSHSAAIIRSRTPTLQAIQNINPQPRSDLICSRFKRLTTSHPYYEIQNPSRGRRSLSTGVVPAVLVPPLVFVGLALTLWFYKCLMMVVFQNKIIYMPSIPPFSRSEKIEDYEMGCRPVHWEEKHICSLDGTKIALCIGSLSRRKEPGFLLNGQSRNGRGRKHVVVMYFQGQDIPNASSLPPRLPFLSEPLKSLYNKTGSQTQFTIVALSYRGYWTSRGRASQRGIEQDALAALRWVQNTYVLDGEHTRLVIWGQSIGAGVATGLLMQNLSSRATNPVRVNGVILETPFVNTRRMLEALYPQKWLPYRYLWPFLRSWWDSEVALKAVAKTKPGRDLPFLIISAAKDEIVPSEQADMLEQLALELGLDVSRQIVSGALHTEATIKSEGQEAIVRFLLKKYVAKNTWNAAWVIRGKPEPEAGRWEEILLASSALHRDLRERFGGVKCLEAPPFHAASAAEA
ncbi:hypothetical protein ACO22_07001 [Paracoccidioides brasiliensis]|uniref:Uncharacterized protein n=1 Tax=Paracoccidioides brasiliensis TaxID=121759 RepID=A0A1D2J5Y5_PARBR|nr:hypothetical protein ACO22_07001 [Paracoccidioides brasiliensis]